MTLPTMASLFSLHEESDDESAGSDHTSEADGSGKDQKDKPSTIPSVLDVVNELNADDDDVDGPILTSSFSDLHDAARTELASLAVNSGNAAANWNAMKVAWRLGKMSNRRHALPAEPWASAGKGVDRHVPVVPTLDIEVMRERNKEWAARLAGIPPPGTPAAAADAYRAGTADARMSATESAKAAEAAAVALVAHRRRRTDAASPTSAANGHPPHQSATIRIPVDSDVRPFI